MRWGKMIHEYSDFTLKTPDCHPNVSFRVARFKLDSDVSHLFPYINAQIDDALYFENPHYIKFSLEGIGCALYPDHAAAAPFAERKEALSFVQRLIAFLNDLESRMDSLEPNYNTHTYIPVLEIFKRLPQTNCKECGYPSCMAFAAAVSKGEASPEQCPECGFDNIEELLCSTAE